MEMRLKRKSGTNRTSKSVKLESNRMEPVFLTGTELPLSNVTKELEVGMIESKELREQHT